MIDFHTHIIPNIDDGSRSIEETGEILKQAKNAGFDKIISTSHYIQNYYDVDEENRKRMINEIQNQNKYIEIFLGSEIYITTEMINLIKNKKASTINNSRYILFELPLNTEEMNAKEMIYRLIENDYIPIIAHPERYACIKKNIKYAQELRDMGALFQANYGSIIGLYGKDAKKTLIKMFKNDMIQFLGTDIHRDSQIYEKIPKILKILRKIMSEEKIEELTTLNAQKVLNNENIIL